MSSLKLTVLSISAVAAGAIPEKQTYQIELDDAAGKRLRQLALCEPETGPPLLILIHVFVPNRIQSGERS